MKRETHKTVHLVEGTDDVSSFGVVPGEPLGTREAVLRGEIVGEGDGSGTYI